MANAISRQYINFPAVYKSGSITGCRDAIDEYKRELSFCRKLKVDRRSTARIIVKLITLVKPTLATARAAYCNDACDAIHLFVC